MSESTKRTARRRLPLRGGCLLPVAEIRTHNGGPTLFIDGQPNAGMTFTAVDSANATKYIGDFARAGVNLVSFLMGYDAHHDLGWPTDRPVDYETLDCQMRSVVRANPRARIFPRIHIDPPPWWCRAHPTAIAREEDGAAWNEGKNGMVASWASPQWRTAACDALAQLIRHVRQSDYAGHVIGYHVASGGTGEWYWWSLWENRLLDYSASNRMAFARFLRRRYGSQSALRHAWRDERATFRAAAIPSREERLRGGVGVFRREKQSRRVIDFHDFHNDIVVETIELLAAVVKHETKRQQLFGVFYGYLESTAESGHLALGRLLQCPDVDFLTAPSAYWGRQIGRGQSRFDAPIASIRLHGKLWFDENDYRTCLTPPGSGYGRTESMRDCIEVQKRELALVVSEGSAMWWFDMAGGWFDDPHLMRAIARINRIAERSIGFDRSSVAEVVVCLDERSMSYVQPSHTNHALGTRLLTRQKLELARMGTPYDCMLLDDLEQAKPYKLYIFPNAFHVTQAQRRVIERVVKRHGRVSVWLYAPGFAGSGDWRARMASLTGFRLACRMAARDATVRIVDDEDALGAGRRGRRRWGCGKLNPLFFVDDPAATTLGVLDGGGETGLAVKRFDDWTSIYSSAVTLPTGLLRAIADAAGVHIYSRRDDALYVNASFLGLHTRTAGRRRLSFPRSTDVFDVFGDRQIASGVTELSIELPAKKTVLYFLGSRARWRSAASSSAAIASGRGNCPVSSPLSTT